MDIDPGNTKGISRRIAAGDTAAFAVFYERWFDRCVIEIRRRTGFDESACLDIVQDAMLRVATNMPVFESEDELERWLRRVLINGARDRIRAETRRLRRESTVRPKSNEQDREAIEELSRRMASLDEESRMLLRSRFDLGWTLERIGRELGLGPGAVDGRIRRLLARLRGER